MQYHYALGRALRKVGKVEEAEEAFQKVLNQSANVVAEVYLMPHSLVQMAGIRFDAGRYGESNEYLKQANNNYSDYDFDKPLIRRIGNRKTEIQASYATNLRH